MRDHNYTLYADGPLTPCSQLPTNRINELLTDGIYVILNDEPESYAYADPIECGYERLRIELVIRGLEGRL